MRITSKKKKVLQDLFAGNEHSMQQTAYSMVSKATSTDAMQKVLQ